MINRISGSFNTKFHPNITSQKLLDKSNVSFGKYSDFGPEEPEDEVDLDFEEKSLPELYADKLDLVDDLLKTKFFNKEVRIYLRQTFKGLKDYLPEYSGVFLETCQRMDKIFSDPEKKKYFEESIDLLGHNDALYYDRRLLKLYDSLGNVYLKESNKLANKFNKESRTELLNKALDCFTIIFNRNSECYAHYSQLSDKEISKIQEPYEKMMTCLKKMNDPEKTNEIKEKFDKYLNDHT